MKASELKNLDLGELMDELNSLDFENVGGWPTPIKIGAAILVLVVVVVLGYFLSISDANQTLEQQRREEATLLQGYEKKAFEAHNLDQFRKQLAEMEQTFGALLKQLPKDTEVPGLLEDITHTGLGSGLEFENIELRNEIEKEFYAELPINIQVIGDYHGFGSFVSGVASLPRIVTLHDFTVTRPSDSNQELAALGLLRMDITAKTYRYSSKDGAAGGANSSGKNK
ncbi:MULTISPECIES: type 4a pilus biogenesis protein PilO [unclassified Alcanivorax]|jgi:type IV pilus assembly protein PilO|uniref:type 4a pilus biogenesis protein PilO n=1 Tax=unclassified Alcanivorax TaxID=2638842 RepID=UPI00017EDDBC|nr:MULTISPECIES: type 4a pilus biogenesis protein PilO [unclassified Alcanivorax]EDX90071.1 Pilus assembly protein, PilO [Alcanivorax sp. DG881]